MVKPSTSSEVDAEKHVAPPIALLELMGIRANKLIRETWVSCELLLDKMCHHGKPHFVPVEAPRNCPAEPLRLPGGGRRANA